MKKISGLIILLLLASCANPQPEGTFKKMQKLACAGDSDGFFQHFDAESITQNIINEANKKRGNTPQPAGMGNFADSLLKTMAGAMVQGMVKELTADIQKKEEAKFCKSKIISAKNGEDSGEVLIEFLDVNKQQGLGFTKSADGVWKWSSLIIPEEAEQPESGT